MKPLGKILFVPALLAATTAVGLVSALVSGDAGDVFGATCLTILVLAGVRPLLRSLIRRGASNDVPHPRKKSTRH